MRIHLAFQRLGQNLGKTLTFLILALALPLISCRGKERDALPDVSVPPAEYALSRTASLKNGEEDFFMSVQISREKIYCGVYSYQTIFDSETGTSSTNSTEKILTFSTEGELLEETVLPLGDTQDFVKWHVDATGNIIITAQENSGTTNTPPPRLRLYKFDAAGELCFQREFDDLSKYTSDSGFHVNDVAADGDGHAFVLLHDTVLTFGADGSFHGGIDMKQNLPLAFADGTDETIHILCRTGDQECGLARADYEGKKAPLVYTGLSQASRDQLADCGETRFLYSTESGPCLYSGDAGEEVLLFSWLDQNLTSSSVRSLGMTEDGTLLCVADNDWGDGHRSTRLMAFSANAPETETSGAQDSKTVITLAAINLSSWEKEAVLAFNRDNEKYRIEVVEYLPNGGDTADARTKMEMDLALDTNGYDIISLDFLHVENLAEKGMFEDLYPFLDESGGLERDDFFESVLDAYTVDGGLISIPDTISVNVLMGKRADFGDRHGWTLPELLDYGKAHPETSRLFASSRQSSVAQILLCNGNDGFIHMEDGNVVFDREICLDVLECLKAHEDTRFESAGAFRLQRGESLLTSTNLYDFESIQLVRAQFGEPVTWLGYPDESGNCAVFYEGRTEYAINSRSDHKEGAWEYLEFYWSNDFHPMQLSSRKSVFEERAAKQIAEQYQRDAAGNIVLDADEQPKLNSTHTYHEGTDAEVWSFTYGPVTEEDVNLVREIIESGGRAWHDSADSVIYQAVMEEGAAYFAGQKPLDTVADILENQLTLYLQENQR